MAIMKKPTSTVTGSKREDQIPDLEKTRPAPGQKAVVDPFAKKYAETEAGKGGFAPPKPGTYNARLTTLEAVIDGNRTYVFFEYTIVEEGDPMEGKVCRQWFNFTNAEGEDETGLPYFKSALAMLGHDENFTSWDSMCDVLEQLQSEPIGVIIKVTTKGKYTNVYLSDVPEDQDSIPTV